MRRPLIRLAATCGALLLLAACASGGTSGSGAASSASAPRRHDRNTITEEDLRNANASNLYEVVQRLHPEWLLTRNGAAVASSRSAGSASDANDVQVYLDNQRGGSLDLLKQITTTRATTLHYFSASEAQARFGNGNLNGVIQVITTPGR